MSEHEAQTSTASPTVAAPAAATVAGSQPGAGMAKGLLASGVRSPDVYASIIRAHPSARAEILAELHGSLGNAFVQRVITSAATPAAAPAAEGAATAMPPKPKAKHGHVIVESEGEWQDLQGHGAKPGGTYGGFSKYGGGRVRDKLTELTNAGVLHLSPAQIAVFDAVSQVETGGQIGCVQTYDDQVVSVGFKQVVLGHGSLERLMRRAPGGFAKHGLQLDATKTYKKSGWSGHPHQIVGCEDVEELRTPAWAIKFYRASMEPDVIGAMCELLAEEQGIVNRSVAAKGGANTNFFEDATAQSWLLEVYNNRPAFTTKAIARASGAAAANREAFLDVLAEAIVETYVVEEPLLHYNKEKKAAARRGKPLTAEQDAKLLADKKKAYEPIGRRKGTNIVKKIGRDLMPAATPAVAAAAPAAAPAPAPATAAAPAPAAATTAPAAPAPAAATTAPATAAATTAPATVAAATPAAAPSAPTTAAVDADEAPVHDAADPAGTAAPAPPVAVEPIAPRQYRVTTDRLNVRAGANTDAEVVGSLRRGAVIEVVGRAGAWLAITHEGVPAFIHSAYAEPTPDLIVALAQGAAYLYEQTRDLIDGHGAAPAAPAAPTAQPAAHPAPAAPTSAQPAQTAQTAQTAPPTAAPAPVPSLATSELHDESLERMVATLDRPQVTAIAGELAGLEARSHQLQATASRKEERGKGRDELVAGIRDLRARLDGLAGIEPHQLAAFKTAVYRKLAAIAPYYFQSRNIDILETPPAAKTRTCNVTCLGMALESLGRTAEDFKGNRAAVVAAARVYNHKIVGDADSDRAADAIAGTGAAWENLVGLRLPDFLELAAIAHEMGKDLTDDGVKAGAKSAWDAILSWGNLQALAGLFGANATIKMFDATGIKTDRRKHTKADSAVLAEHGNKTRMPVERYINAENQAEATGSKRNIATAEALRPGYERAVADDSIDDRLSLDTYRDHIVGTIGPELDAGNAVIVGLSGHFVRLQAIGSDHVIVDDPARDTRSATKLTFAEARAMGYFHMRFVIS